MATNNATTKLVSHFEGTPGAQLVVDDSVGGTAKTIVVHGTLDDTQKKFGDTSIRSIGVSGAVDYGQSIDWKLGTSIFTVDVWAYLNDRPNVFVWYLDPNNHFGVSFVSGSGTSGKLAIRWRVGGVDKLDAVSGTKTLLGGWYHFAIARLTSGALNLYLGGKPIAGGYPTGRLDLQAHNLYLGRGLPYGNHTTLNGTDGWFDEMRVGLDNEMVSVPAPTPPASFGDFLLRTETYAPALRLDATGAYGVRGTRSVHAEGKYGLGLIARRVDASGVFSLKAARVATPSGVFHVKQAGRKVDASGLYYLGGVTTPTARTKYTHDAAGASVGIQRPVAFDASGGYNVLDRVCTVDASGEYILRAARVVTPSGVYATLAARIAHAAGQYQVESPDDVIEVYRKVDAWPVVGVDAVWYTATAYPFTPPTTLTVEGVHHFIVVHRNKYELRSLHADDQRYDQSAFVIEIDAAGDEVVPVPTAPWRVWAMLANGNVTVRAVYDAAADAADVRANRWKVYSTAGLAPVDPDPDVDSPVTFGMPTLGVRAVVELSGSYSTSAGHVRKFIVRTARTSDGRESQNSNVVSITNNASTPADVLPRVFVGRVNARKELV